MSTTCQPLNLKKKLYQLANPKIWVPLKLIFYSHALLNSGDTFCDTHRQVISSSCKHHRVRYTNLEGRAYYAPRLYGVVYCSQATSLRGTFPNNARLNQARGSVMQSRDAVNPRPTRLLPAHHADRHPAKFLLINRKNTL